MRDLAHPLWDALMIPLVKPVQMVLSAKLGVAITCRLPITASASEI